MTAANHQVLSRPLLRPMSPRLPPPQQFWSVLGTETHTGEPQADEPWLPPAWFAKVAEF